MILFPAIDLRGGQCVRLRQGDYRQETVFNPDPSAAARDWARQGAQFLHLVDLDGARDGRPVNGNSVRKIVEASGLPCQLGGGLRTDADVAEALGWGVARVILGTRALQDPDWFTAVCRKHPGQVVAGIDARHGKVATDGWLQTSDVTALDLAGRCAAGPLAAIVYTDISRDGMMQGPNFEALAEMAAAFPGKVVASGGVTRVDDVRRLSQLGLAGCIIGRALYEGTIDLREALQAVASP